MEPIPGDDDPHRKTVRRLEREHPNWIVLFGVYTKQYVAFPRFGTPGRIRLESYDPDDLGRRMRDIEQYFGIPARLADRQQTNDGAKGG